MVTSPIEVCTLAAASSAVASSSMAGAAARAARSGRDERAVGKSMVFVERGRSQRSAFNYAVGCCGMILTYMHMRVKLDSLTLS